MASHSSDTQLQDAIVAVEQSKQQPSLAYPEEALLRRCDTTWCIPTWARAAFEKVSTYFIFETCGISSASPSNGLTSRQIPMSSTELH